MRNEEPYGPPEPEALRREFRFKPTEFEVANRPVDATPANAPIDVNQLYRQANAPKPPPPARGNPTAPPPAENEVHAVLRANLARAQAQGENEVIPARRRLSRRKRDYWLLLALGNALVVGIVLAVGINAMTLAFGFTGIVVLSLVLTWIMWMVLDDY
jgi:hypothetical protein